MSDAPCHPWSGRSSRGQLQDTAQGDQPTVLKRFDGPVRLVEDLGHGSIVQALEESENDYLPLVLGQLFQGSC